MSKLVEIISKTGKCLCAGCRLFKDTTDIYCPISYNAKNAKFEGELLSELPRKDTITSWCDFKYCGIDAGDKLSIWQNPGYKVKGRLGQYMWIPESIVILATEAKKIRAQEKIKNNRSKLARIAIRK